MKQLLTGLVAVLLAFGVASFSGEKSPRSPVYWFALDGSGNQIPKTTVPVSITSDPYGCVPQAPIYCSRAYGEYETVPGSSPARYRGKAGTEIATHFKFGKK